MNIAIESKLPQIKELMLRYGVVKAYLIGSAATGHMTIESDIDFLVSFKKNLSYTEYGDNYFNLTYALQDLLKKDVELVAEETLTNPYLIQSINNQKISVL